jgi:BirA family transcriptional regulator, biotin operon repressor / biotin---[acetyl-CoA-carboxylase] ligase
VIVPMRSINEHTVDEAARAAGITAPVHFVPVIGSTNTDLIRMAEAGAPEWTLVAAGQQTAGRGRLGRTWVSKQDGSLIVSLLLRPDIPASRAPLLSMGNAVCMAEACRSACGVDVRTRWPNDLMVGERKIGGILPEASVTGGRLAWVVLGTGLNVGHSPGDFPDELRASATSIAIEGGRLDLPGLLRDYLARLRGAYSARDGFRPEMLDSYRALCITLGRTVRAITVSGDEVVGRAVAVGDQGELLVETGSGAVTVAFGEIEHLR